MSSVGAGMDPLTQALIASLSKNSSNPWMAALQGLGPLGGEILKQSGQYELVPAPRPAQPSTSIAPPLNLQPGAPPASPVAEAALISQLL